ncbi:MAG TPA: FAD-dependent oxidoreductase [Nitriliruptorales bacterium]|nr:FAD-dependent oxidoreductase [Nitriliruptorales bacterium]
MTNSSETGPRVAVLGAGYAGVTAAKLVAKHSSAAVTLINDRDRFQERMRNHQLATGQRLRELPLRDLLKRTGIRLVIDRVTRIDPEERQVELASEAEPVGYDQLIYALGSHADLDAPGAAEHATAVATAEHAQQVRDRVSGADTIAVVGGGLTGIETVTELAETYPDRTVLMVTRGTPGAMLNERARQHLYRTFDRLGIKVLTDAAVAKVARDGLLLESGDHVDADAVVWTTGFAVPTLAREAGLDVDDRGRILVDPTLRSVSHADVYGVGDAAAARNEDGHVVRMGCGPGGIAGVIGALALADRLADRAPRPYRYHDVAWHISLGRRDGIVQLGPDEDSRVLTGRPAAFIKERVALRGSVWGLRHPAGAVFGAKRY